MLGQGTRKERRAGWLAHTQEGREARRGWLAHTRDDTIGKIGLAVTHRGQCVRQERGQDGSPGRGEPEEVSHVTPGVTCDTRCDTPFSGVFR